MVDASNSPVWGQTFLTLQRARSAVKVEVVEFPNGFFAASIGYLPEAGLARASHFVNFRPDELPALIAALQEAREWFEAQREEG